MRGRSRLLSVEELENRVVPTLLGQQIFPADYPWNQNISNAPVASNSPSIITHIGGGIGIHPDWGDDSPANGANPLYGIPVNVVHGNASGTTHVNVTIDNYPGESDIVPVPIPANAVIEGDFQNGPNNGPRGDSHLIVWDEDNNIAYELYGATRPSDPNLFPDTNGVVHPHTDTLWHAAQESVWHTASDSFRPVGYTSADAAGLSILAGLARPDEGLPANLGGQGAINHALRFTLPSGDVNAQYIYPASHVVGSHASSVNLPMGARLRLQNTTAVNNLIAGMGSEAQIIAHAMQQYGLVLADIGSAMYVTGDSGSVDANNALQFTWNMNDVLGLHALTASNFDVIDLTPRVTNLSVSNGPTGSTLTVIGRNFSGAAGHLTVFFGSTAATQVTVVDDSHLTVTVPFGSGTVDVRVQSGVNATDPNNPADNVNNPIFGYGTSATSTADLFTFNNVPSDITALNLSSSSVLEFRPTGTFVGAFSTTETSSGHTYTYTLVPGSGSTDNASFVISGNQLLTADAFDFAARSTYSIRVRTTNEANQLFEQTFTITIGNDPLLTRSGQTLTVSGTAGNDTFTFTPGAVRDAFTLNGVNLAVDVASASTIAFQGNGGSDSATLNGGPGADVASLAPFAGQLSGPGYKVTVSGVARLVAVGASNDAAYLFDMPNGTTTYVAAPTYAYLQGTGFMVYVTGFGSETANAQGSSGVAYLYDSAGNDMFVATPTYAYLAGPGFFEQANGYKVVSAQASSGSDAAYLHDGPGNNTFVGTPTYAYLTGAGYYNQAVGFKSVTAYDDSGYDAAYLYAAPSGTNTYVATPTYAYLIGTGYFNEAAGFKSVTAYSNAGNDVAYLYDSPGNDSFVGTPTASYLTGTGFFNEAVGFKAVTVQGGAGGSNAASFYYHAGDTLGAYSAFGRSYYYAITGGIWGVFPVLF
jgi:hypothetical protein